MCFLEVSKCFKRVNCNDLTNLMLLILVRMHARANMLTRMHRVIKLKNRMWLNNTKGDIKIVKTKVTKIYKIKERLKLLSKKDIKIVKRKRH